MDEPNVSRRHLWGRRVDIGTANSSEQPTLLVLAHSPVAKAGQISEMTNRVKFKLILDCAGVPFHLEGVETDSQDPLYCLIPGCRHSTVSRLEAESL